MSKKILQQFFEMMFPTHLKENEYIRLIALQKNNSLGEDKTIVKYVKNFDEYEKFANKYKYNYDCFQQLSTNRGQVNGTKTSQRMRKVMYFDFDKKDYPNLKNATQLTQLIKNKLPNLFICCVVDSGNGFHVYISIKQTCKVNEYVELNKELGFIMGADPKALSPTQISRIPTTYNHKLEDGTRDYENKDLWKRVTIVFNGYRVNDLYKPLELSYLRKLKKRYDEDQKTKATLEVLEKIKWDYVDELSMNKLPKYFCIEKILKEGTEKGQRNFWLGRIVKLLQMQGYKEEVIYNKCLEWNKICQPPKSENEVKTDVKNYLAKNYNLLGCYSSFGEDTNEYKWVFEQCDKAFCSSYQNGAKINLSKSDGAKINKKVIENKHLQRITGNEYLIITLLDVYANRYGRRGFRVRDLKRLLFSTIRKKPCINDKTLKQLLIKLSKDEEVGNFKKKKWIELTKDRKSNLFDDYKIKLVKRLKEFNKGYIEFYFSIAQALIDRRISQTDYLIYITLVRNLADGRSVTYEQLADDLKIEPQNIRKHIKHLEREKCLIIEKQPTDKGYEYNRYRLIDCNLFNDLKEEEYINNEDVNVTLLA